MNCSPRLLESHYQPLDFVKPICLPYHDDVDDNYRRDKNGVDLEAVIAGWGATVNKGKSFSIEYFCEYLVNIFQNISTFIALHKVQIWRIQYST